MRAALLARVPCCAREWSGILEIGKLTCGLSFNYFSLLETKPLSTMASGRGRKKRKVDDADSDASAHVHALHQFKSSEASQFCGNLLKWFAKNKRDLPWRRLALQGSPEERAYAVLVSEVMLQQTQVVTVKDYYTKWMARWPNFGALAKASPEEVNEMWSGLGYYARGKRLHEAAKEMHKKSVALPCPAAALEERLPGVGRYTAAAVASIVFGEKVAAVDGNVVRVLARQRMIGGEATSPSCMKSIWNIANDLIDPQEPGNFNEAMMELGAVVCTPKAPKCNECPVKGTCLAYKFTKMQGKNNLSLKSNIDVPDIETVPDCKLCLPTEEEFYPDLGVMNFPRKAKKSAPRKQESVVWILQRLKAENQVEYFVVKRPDKGLLANLWEFPCYLFESQSMKKSLTAEDFAKEQLEEHHAIVENDLESVQFVGSVVHVFSHIHQMYTVFEGKLLNEKSPLTSDNYKAQQWLNGSQFKESAVSTAMRKVFNLLASKSSQTKQDSAKRKGPIKRSMITDFFTEKSTSG